MSQASSVDIVINAATQQASAAMMDFGAKFAAALSVQKILQFILTTSEAIERTGRLAEGVGMAVEEFSDLQASAKLSDVEIGELSAGLRTFNGQIAEASKSGSQAGAIFRAMGIDVQGKNTAQILNEVADAFQSYENGAKKTALAQQLFGRGSLEMISWLNKGSAGMRESAALAAELGVTLDQTTVEAASDVSDAWKKMTMAFSASGNELVKTLGPALARMIDILTDVIKHANEASRILGKVFGPAIDYVSKAIMVLAGSVDASTQIMFSSLALLGSTFKNVLSGNLDAVKDDWEVYVDSVGQEYEEGRKKIEALLAGKGPKSSTGKKEAPSTGVPKDSYETLNKLNNEITARKESIELIKQEEAQTEMQYQNGQISADLYFRRVLLYIRDQYIKEQEIIDLKRAFLNGELKVEVEKRGTIGEITEKEAQIQARINDLLIEELRLKGQYKSDVPKTQAAYDKTTFTGGLHDAAEAMDNFSDHGKAAATIFRNTFGTAIQGLSSGIMGLIRGTMTWGQAMLRIGDSILENIISMILEYTVFHQIRMVFDQLFHAAAKTNITTTSGVANTAVVSNATTQAGANATIASTAITASTAETGATFGMNWVVGLAIGIAAIAALMAAFGAFESGGLVPGGEQFVRVNERGPEFILNAQTTQRLGQPALEALNRGIMPTATFGARSSSITSVAAPMQSSGKAGSGAVNVSFGQLSDRNALRQFMAGEGSKIVLSQFNRRSNKINL